MKQSVSGLISNAIDCFKKTDRWSPFYAAGLRDLEKNLRTLRDAHKVGEGQQALDQFFALYVFEDRK
jgi:hypothetical protein